MGGRRLLVGMVVERNNPEIKADNCYQQNQYGLPAIYNDINDIYGEGRSFLRLLNCRHTKCLILTKQRMSIVITTNQHKMVVKQVNF